jgi:hypothetical protein
MIVRPAFRQYSWIGTLLPVEKCYTFFGDLISMHSSRCQLCWLTPSLTRSQQRGDAAVASAGERGLYAAGDNVKLESSVLPGATRNSVRAPQGIH